MAHEKKMTGEPEKLAIHGGPATFPEGGPRWPKLSPEIRERVMWALENDQWGLYQSEIVNELTQRLCEVFSVRLATLCSSGTIAVELALRGAGVKKDSEVILAGYDFPGNFRAIESIGALPVLVDLAPNSWSLDLNQVEDAISERTSAVVVSHLHGEIQAVNEICDRLQPRGIRVIEDNCQSPGGTWLGKPLGSLGDVASLSFGGSKLLTAGRGGAVLTDDEQIIQRIKVFAHRGNDAFPLSTLQAAALLPQLESLAGSTERRQKSVNSLLQSDLQTPLLSRPSLHPDAVGGFYKLGWFLDASSQFAVSRDSFLHAAKAEGLDFGPGFRGFAKRSARRCRKISELSNAISAAQTTVLLHHPVLLEPEQTIGQLNSGIRKLVHYFVNPI